MTRSVHASRRAGQLRRSAIALAALCIAPLVAEFGVRWAVEGGFGPALASIGSGNPTRPFTGPRDGLIFDTELGYRRDPQAPPEDPRDVTNPAVVPAKGQDTARILLVGGAMSRGPAVRPGAADGYVKLLRETLGERAELLDASVPGYTTHQERLWLEQHLLALKPNLVVVAYSLDDNHRFLYRLDPARGLVMREQARRELFPTGGGAAGWLASNSYLALRLRLRLHEWRTPPNKRFPWDSDYAVGPAWRDDAWKPWANELALTKTLTEHAGSGLLLVIIPMAAQFEPELIERDARYVFKPQIKALEAANSLHIAALDLVPEFQRQDGRTLFEANGLELNTRGQALVADALRKRILDSGILPETGR